MDAGKVIQRLIARETRLQILEKQGYLASESGEWTEMECREHGVGKDMNSHAEFEVCCNVDSRR
jgi:hypothetical protein